MRKKSNENPFVVFHFFRVSKFLMLKMVMSWFSVDILLSRSTEKLRNGAILCFRKELIPERVKNKKGAGITTFRQICFVWHYGKTSYRNPSVVHKVSDNEKNLPERKGPQFSKETLLSHRTEKLPQWTLLCFKIFWYWEKLWIMGERRSTTTFLQNFFVSECRKTSQESPLALHKLQVSKIYA